MQNIVGANQHKNAAQKLREIADQQPFKIEVFHETFPFADQYIIIVPVTIRSIIISLICMATVAVMLIPSLAPCKSLNHKSRTVLDYRISNFLNQYSVSYYMIKIFTLILKKKIQLSKFVFLFAELYSSP